MLCGFHSTFERTEVCDLIRETEILVILSRLSTFPRAPVASLAQRLGPVVSMVVPLFRRWIRTEAGTSALSAGLCCAGTSFWTVGAAARVNVAAATERGGADLTGLFGFGIGGADVTCLNRGGGGDWGATGTGTIWTGTIWTI